MSKHRKPTIRRAGIWLVVLSLIAGVFWPASAYAQNNPTPPAQPGSGQALEIAPPVINLTANPGQTIRTQISLRDVSSGKLLVRSQVNDFVAAGEDGTPKILLEEDEESPYSLKSWIAPLPELTLEPRQIRNLPVVINVPANAAPGGYYGVVRFTATPPELEGTGVSLSTSLGSLILVRVNGAANQKLEIAEFLVADKNGKAGSLFQSAPLQFIERIRNTGNIHEQPAGQVTITDMFGKKVAAVNVNLPPRNILPGSVRKFEQPLDKAVIGNKQLFGKYTAELKLTYANNQSVSSSVSFWVIPYKLIAIILVALVGGFFLLRFLIRRYNRRVISRAYGGKTRRR